MAGLIVFGIGLARSADFDVTKYGAKGDGASLDTAAIQETIEMCARSGGGRVVLPTGVYRSGTLFLRSNVEFHLNEGAVLLASAALSDYNADDAYPQNWGSVAEGWSAKHLMIALEVENVAVTGTGTIDGNARAFFADQPQWKGSITWRDGAINARTPCGRPGQAIVFVESMNVRVEGVRIRDMPCWSCFFYGCEKVRVRNVDVANNLRYLNTDGFDVDSCRDVEISSCSVLTGDDAFAIRGAPTRLRNTNRACEDVYIHDCTGRVSACGVRVGVGDGTIRNVRIRNLNILGAGRGIAVQCNYGVGRGGVNISNVSFENVQIKNAAAGISVTGGMGEPTARMDDIVFRNVEIEAFVQPIRVTGRGKVRPLNVRFENVTLLGKVIGNIADDGETGGEKDLPGTDEPVRILSADNVVLENVTEFSEGVRRPARVAFRDLGPRSRSDGGFSVALPPSAKLWEKTAADALTRYLTLRLGSAKLVAADRSGLTFHVGDTELARARGMASDAFADEAWAVRQFGGDVIVNGGGTRGCIYAASHFLEDLCGIRFWSELEEDIPAPSSLSLGEIDIKGKPAFAYRDIYRTMDARHSRSDHAIRRRLNRNGDVKVPMTLGGAFDYGTHHCHTFDHYVSWKALGQDNPELFSLVDGKRCGGQDYATGGQLCLSNPKVRERVLAGVCKAMDSSAEKARRENRAEPRLFEVSMNDNKRYCCCKNCQAAYDHTSITDVYFNFYNGIAADVAAHRPEALVTTLAYYDTEELPKTDLHLRDNLLVKLCNTRANKAVSLLHPDNHILRDLILGWRTKVRHLFIWDYAITYTQDSKSFPFPSEFFYGDKFSFYHTNAVAGVFIEQEYPECADFYDIKYYLLTRFLEDPGLDAVKALEAACAEYFGPAAGAHVFAARKRLFEASVRNRGELTWTPQFNMFNFIRAEDLAFMLAEFDAAEKTAGDRRILRRLKYAKRGVAELAARRDGMVRRVLQTDGRSAWVFNPEKFGLYGKEKTLLRKDEKAEGGWAVRIDTDAKGCACPLVYGYFDQRAKKTIVTGKLADVPEDGTYHIIDAASVTVPENGYLYLTTDWLVQVHMASADLVGRTYRIKVHVRRDGRHLYLGRVVFVESDEDGEGKHAE